MNDRPPTYEELKRRLASAEGALKALRDGQVDTIAGEHGTMVVRLAEAEARADHIKQVLQTIRNVNQLIISENDPKQLIERACCSLTRTTGYYNAWIVLLADGCGAATAVASSGLNESFNLLEKQFRGGMYTHCMCRALNQDEIIVVEDPAAECASCSLSADHGARSGLSRRLRHGGKTYGILSVSVPSTYAYDQEALALFEEVAGNLAFALRKIEAAKELSDNQVDLKRAQSLAQLGSWRFDLQTGKVIASDEARNIYGIGKTELTIDAVRTLPLPQYKDDLDVRLKNLISKGIPYDAEFQIRRPSDDALRYIHSVAEYDAEFGIVIGTIQDITTRKRTEEALRASERLLVQSQQIAHVGSWVLDVTANHLTWSDETYRIFGLEPQEFAATYESFLDAVHPKDRSAVNAAYSDSILRKQDGYEIEHQIIRNKTGEIRDVYEKCIHERNSAGEIIRSIGVVQDITERKQIEETIRARERYLRTILQTTADGFWVIDAQGVLIECNQAYCAMSGYSREELLGKCIEDLEAKEDPAQVIERMQRIIAHGFELFETIHRRKDGSVWPVEVSTTWLNEDGGRFICFCRDLSERKQREDRITLLGQMVDSAPASITIHNAKGRVLFANRITASLHGFSEEEFLDINLDDLIVPESQYLLNKKGQIEESGEARFEVVHYRKDRSTFPLEVLTKNIIWQDYPAILNIATDITERKQIEKELHESEERNRLLSDVTMEGILVHKDGIAIDLNSSLAEMLGYNRGELLNKNFMQLIHEDDHVIVHRNIVKEYAPPYVIRIAKKNGQHLFVEIESRNLKKQDEVLRVSAVRDITDRRQAEDEKNKLQEQLLQSQKMESIGRLAGGVAHDFNNMLGVILGYSEMAVEQVAEGHPILATLHEIQQAAQRSADLTKQLLAFARKQTAVPKVLDLNTTVESMLAMLRRLIGENIDLLWLPGKGLGLIKIDPSQVDQILANLCVNSRDSIIGNTGKITIETANFDADETFCAEHTDIGPGKYIQLTFSDNGSGMEPEILSHLFEPFFTTKNLGEGTGLGLAMIYGIVKQNHGAISVNSMPGRGTTFRIYLPLYEAKADSVQIDNNIAKEAGCETILLVEDEPMILEMTTLMLKGLGYNILSAATPVEAVCLAEEHAGEIQMLMTDVIMPEMNGRDLAQKLSSLHPEIKRLFMSGYTADIIAQQGVLEEEMNFLQKPFSRKELSAKVREVLAQGKE